jgi:uncharacterized repeat protein (TIGR02543 family)
MTANELSFNLGGTAEAPTVPETIDSINVKTGTILQSFLESRHPAFIQRLGGFSQAPAREGYKFLGWYLDEAFEIPLSSKHKMTGSPVTLYARWE